MGMESSSESESESESIRVRQGFIKGSRVEVSSNEDGFRGSYFVATIIEVEETPPKSPSPSTKLKNDFLVEYQTLLTEDSSKPLREYVDLGSIRPLPPLVNEESLGLNDVVDAYYEEGWWIGVIAKVLEESKSKSKRFCVFFSDPPHAIDFNLSDLRVHFDWVDGKWVRPPKNQEVLSAINCLEQLGHAISSADKPEEAVLESSRAAKRSAEVITHCSKNSRKSPMEKSDSRNDKSPLHKVTPRRKQMKQATPISDSTLSRCSKKLREGSGDASVVKSRKMPVEMENEAAFSVCTTLNTGGTVTVCTKQLVVGSQPYTKTESAFGEIIQHKQCAKLIPKRRGRSPKSIGKVSDGAGGSTSEMFIMDCTSTEVELPIITEVESTTTGGSECKNTFQLYGMVCNGVGGATYEMVVKDCTSTEVEPPIITEVESTTAGASRCENSFQLSGKVCNGVGGATHEMVVKDCRSTEVELPIITEVESPTAGASRCENTFQLSGCQDAIGGKADDVSTTDCMLKEAEMAIVGLSSNTVDHQPLFIWSKGMCSPTIVDNSSNLSWNVNQWNDARETQVETAIQEVVMEASSDSVPDENQSLTFVKSLPIWEVIESCEAFRKMPQKPHFHPLHSQKEVWREGLALASMVTFVSVVEMISKLKFDDPKSNFYCILEALPDLEMHGFDVKAMRNRVNELLSIKARQEKHAAELKEMESQIMEKTETINESVKMIKDLEEKRAILLSMNEKKDSEIVRLSSSLDVISEGIQSVDREFETVAVAAASW